MRRLEVHDRKVGWKFLRLWLPVILWAAIIFALSSVPSGSTGSGGINTRDALGHLIEYFVLGVLLTRALGRVDLAILVAAAYGITDELHQMLVDGRTATVVDWLFDVVGAVVGVATAKAWMFGVSRKRHVSVNSRQ